MCIVWWLACATRLPPSYAEAPSWLELEALLPVDQRPVGAELPTEDWWAWRGHRVHVDVHDPDGPPRGVVLLVHGGGGHGRLLSPFALPLRRAGYRVLAPDLPGYGLTEEPRGAKPVLGDWSALVADLAAEEGAKGLPVAVFGLSVGGTVALHAAMRTEAIDALVVTTLLDLQDPDVLRAVSRRPSSVGLMRRFGGLVSGMRRKVRRLAPFDAMSSRLEIGEQLARDELVGARRVSLRFFVSFLDTAPPADLATFDRVPLLVAHPAADAWTAPALSRPLFEAYAGPKAWVNLDGATHLPLERPGWDQLADAALDWLDRHASR